MGANHHILELSESTPWFIRLKRKAEACVYKSLLRFYLFGARLVWLPLIGKILKRHLEWYAATQHGGKIVSKEEVCQWIEKAGSILCSICYCRDTFGNCSATLINCLRISDVKLFQVTDGKRAKISSKEEAKGIINDAEKMGLFHLVAWCSYPKVYAICNCCRCCCVAYQIWSKYKIEKALQRGDMIALKDNTRCIDCGRCVERCGFGAINRLQDGKVEFSPENCFGCGICREACENEAIRLVRR